MISQKTRIHALALFLNMEKQCGEEGEYPQILRYTRLENTFSLGEIDYLVLTDEEADEKARKKALEDIWTCDVDFLISYFKKSIIYGLLDNDWKSLKRCLWKLQEEMCEDSNGFFRTLLEDEENFCNAVISDGGRGNLLSGRDSEENCQVIVPWDDITHLAVKFMDGELGPMGKVLQKALREEDLDGISIFCDWAEENNFHADQVQELRDTARKITLFIYRQ